VTAVAWCVKCEKQRQFWIFFGFMLWAFLRGDEARFVRRVLRSTDTGSGRLRDSAIAIATMYDCFCVQVLDIECPRSGSWRRLTPRGCCCRRSTLMLTIATLVVACAAVGTAAAKNTNVHMTYHWHMQQPIYWPAQSQEDPNTYQRAAESVKLTSSQGGSGGSANLLHGCVQ